MLTSKMKFKLLEKKMSQTKLAEHMGVSKQTVNGWVNSKFPPPLETAFKLAQLLDCNIEDLWEYEDKPKED